MEALVGLVASQGRPVDAEDAGRMWSAARDLSLEFRIHRLEQAFLGYIGGSPGKLHVDPASGVAVAASVRLDNRAALFGQLGFGAGQHENISDEELLVAVYARYGSACSKRLLGDWAFAIWDPGERTLLLSRDHAGMRPLFYHFNGSTLAFSSSLKPLLGLPWISKRPNLLHVSKIACSWPPDGIETAYEGIYRVPAAHTLTFKNGKIELCQYWTIQSESEQKFASQAEAIEAFGELYSDAVRCRMRTERGVGVMLSGGLDSSSVCALAAQAYGRRGARLPAFTSTPKYPCFAPSSTAIFDETPFVESLRSAMPNLDVRFVCSETLSLLAGMEQALDLVDEPLAWADNAHWILEILKLTAGKQIGTLLTGQMGNSTVSFEGFKPDTAATLFREFLRRSLARPAREFIRRRREGYRWPMLAHSPINVRFAEKHDLVGLRGRDPFAPNLRAMPKDRKRQLAAICQGLRMGDGVWNVLGSGFGVAVADPTCDKRVVEFCASLPLEYFRHGELGRWLIRGAMEGLVPDDVRLNVKKGAQSADLGRRIAEARPELEKAAIAFEGNALVEEVLDLAKLKRVLANIENYSQTEARVQGATVILRGISVGSFLARF